MPYKSLTSDEIEQLKKMAIAGTAPKDIAAFFGIGIASVHNHKTKLKEQGVILPDVRGQRAKGYIEGHDFPSISTKTQMAQNIDMGDAYKFVINGRPVIVTGPVKMISITPEGLVVTY